MDDVSKDVEVDAIVTSQTDETRSVKSMKVSMDKACVFG